MDDAGPSIRQVEGAEVDVDWLQLIKTNQEVRLGGGIPLEGLPLECNLLAVSNVWGLVVVGGADDIRIHRLSELQAQVEASAKDGASCTPSQTISLPSRPVWIRLAMNDERLVISTASSSSLHVYRLADILRGRTEPYHTFTAGVPDHLLDVLPNPAQNSERQARYVALVAKEGMVLADIEERRLMGPIPGPFTSGCWSAKGKQIVLGTPDGRLTRYTPEGVNKGELPPPDLEQPGYPAFIQWVDGHVFLAGYAPTDGSHSDPLEVFLIARQATEITYTKFYDPVDTMGLQGRSGRHRYFANLKQWGERTRSLGFTMSGLASEVAVLHGNLEGELEVCMLEETARAVMPIGKAGAEDTTCLGLSLDLTSTRPVKRGISGGVALPDLPPAPRLLVYGQNGTVISFDVLYPDAGAYPGMVQPREITESMGMISAPAATTPPPDTGSSGFGGFGGSTFGQAPASPAAPAPTAFGQASTPAFGTSAFGSSAFDTPSKPAGFSGFGQTSGAGGFAGFGQASTTPTSTPAKTSSAFGSVTAPSATTTPSGQPPASSGSAFGQSSFGQSSTPGAFGQPAFGQTSASAFGQSSFGQSSGPAAFGAASSPNSVGFGAFGNAKPAASSTGFGLGKSAFGASYQDPTKSRSGFGGSTGGAFGASSAFGQSTFGSSAFGQSSTPAFAGFGQQSKPASDSSFPGTVESDTSQATSPAPTAGDDFGFGGFASALSGSGQASGVPGLEDSPPTSPVLRSVPAGLHEDDSPPSTPVFGKAQSASGSAFIKPATAFGGGAAFGSSSASSSAPSFIKPATAFGGSGTSAFGGFGLSSTAKAATETANVPSPAAPPSGVAFGTSKPSTPAFGSGTAFGQSSKPTAFGQASVPSTGGFGNISGGFGGFAAKSTSSTVSSGTGSGGFGGFAASASKPSTGFAVGSGGGFGALLSGDKPAASGDVFGKKDKVEPKVEPPTPVKTESAASPQGKKVESAAEEPAGSPSPSPPPTPAEKGKEEVLKPEPAVLPAGYDSPQPVVKAEPAVLPAGYDVPVTTQVASSSSTEDAKPPKEALRTALPEPSPATEVSKGEPAEIPLPPLKDAEEAHEDPSGLSNSGYEVVEPEDEDEEYDGSEEEEGEAYSDEEEASYEEDDEEQEGDSGAEADEADLENEEEDEAEDKVEEAVDVPDEGDSAQETGQKSGRKSPPTWFSDTPQTSSSGTDESVPVPAQPSAPPAPPKFAFNNKHAARTASPLGSQPPEIASVTPPVSPFKADFPTGTQFPAGGFNMFAPLKEEAAGSGAAAKPDVKPLFGFGLGKPSTPQVDPAATKAVTVPTPSSFGGPPRAPSPLPPAPTQKSAFGFGGLGLGQPPAPLAPAPNPKAAFDFGLPKAEQKSPSPPAGNVKSLASVFESPPKADKAVPFSFDTSRNSTTPIAAKTAPIFGALPSAPLESKPTASAIPKPQVSKPAEPAPTPPPPPATSFAVPARQAVPPRTQRKSSSSATMASVMEGLVEELQADLRHLQQYLASAVKQHATLRDANFIKITAADLQKHSALPFSSINDTSDIADSFAKQLHSFKSQDDPAEPKLAELQSLLLKTDMKSGTLEQFAKARDDASFAKAIEVTQLSAQQAADQARLSEAVQDIESGMEDLEMALTGLKRRLDEVTDGSAGSSSVERLERSIRNLDTSIHSRQQTLDDLSRRFNSIDLSASPARSHRPAQTPYISLATPLRQSPAKPAALRVPADILAEVQAALDHDPAKDVLSRLKRQTRMTKASTSGPSIFSHASRGALSMDSIPAPGQASLSALEAAEDRQKPASPEIKTEPDASSSPTAAASAFSGIKFSLDPGQFSSQHRSGGGGRASISVRQHAPAPRLGTTNLTSAGGTGSMPGGFDFALPSPSGDKGQSAKKGEPSGFFSLSGFASK